MTVRPPSPLGLTPRQAEVLRLMQRGLTNAEIAAALGLSPQYVKCDISPAIYRKLGVQRRRDAIAVADAWDQGVAPPPITMVAAAPPRIAWDAADAPIPYHGDEVERDRQGRALPDPLLIAAFGDVARALRY